MPKNDKKNATPLLQRLKASIYELKKEAPKR